MTKNIVNDTRKFLKDNNIDYLLVNSTNEYLVEYSPLQENARYALTGFSGSTGDAVISQKEILLFVDGRYHTQADSEVDKNLVTVVKMQLGDSFSALLSKKLSPNSTFAIISKKNSQSRLEMLETILNEKNIDVKLIDFDPILETQKGKDSKKQGLAVKIDTKITGLSSKQKIAKISKTLASDEAILITNLEEISYLLNLRDFSNNYSSKVQDGKLLITKDGFSQKFETPAKVTKVLVDKSQINAYDYSLLGKKAFPMKENPVAAMKSVKTNEEIEHYKKCFERTDKALLATHKFIEQNKNISEADIDKVLEENFYKFGAKSLSFKSIIAKDKNSASAHYSKNSNSEILKDGSLVLIDCGAYYEGGYATDITRVFVNGTPSKLQKQVYTTVLKAFLKAFNKKITVTTTGFAIDKAARELLNKIKPEGFEFSHGLGHGIGINVHEAPPRLAASIVAKTPIRPNMCFTIEPGLYNPKHFGVRLENSCYLAKNNEELTIKSFTNMPFEKKLIDLKLLTTTTTRF